MAFASPMPLPIIERVAWEGWNEDRVSEADVWVESRALARLGWSETNWRWWLSELGEEAERRRAWWTCTVAWCRTMGMELGGETACQEQAWGAMYAVELERRLRWGVRMREESLYGEEYVVWRERLRSSGVWARWMQELGALGDDDG